MKKQTQCPKCEGYKILNQKQIAWIAIPLGVFTLFIFIGYIFLAIGIYFLFFGKFYCQSCGYKWTTSDSDNK